MRCTNVKKHLAAYIDGELPEGIRRDVARHISSCESCRRERAALEHLRTAVESMEQIAGPPVEMASDVLRIARTETARQRVRESRPLIVRLFPSWRPAFAMVLVVCAMGMYFLFQPLRRLMGPSPEELYIAERMDLFQNLELIRDLSILEAIEAGEIFPGESG